MRSFPNLKGALKTIQPEWRNASVQYSNASSVNCRTLVRTISSIAVIRNFVLWALSGNNPQRLFEAPPCRLALQAAGGNRVLSGSEGVVATGLLTIMIPLESCELVMRSEERRVGKEC